MGTFVVNINNDYVGNNYRGDIIPSFNWSGVFDNLSAIHTNIEFEYTLPAIGQKIVVKKTFEDEEYVRTVSDIIVDQFHVTIYFSEALPVYMGYTNQIYEVVNNSGSPDFPYNKTEFLAKLTAEDHNTFELFGNRVELNFTQGTEQFDIKNNIVKPYLPEINGPYSFNYYYTCGAYISFVFDDNGAVYGGLFEAYLIFGVRNMYGCQLKTFNSFGTIQTDLSKPADIAECSIQTGELNIFYACASSSLRNNIIIVDQAINANTRLFVYNSVTNAQKWEWEQYQPVKSDSQLEWTPVDLPSYNASQAAFRSSVLSIGINTPPLPGKIPYTYNKGLWGEERLGIGAQYFDYLPPPPPVNAFSFTPRKGSAPLSVQFSEELIESNVTGFLWNFGDGETSTDINPIHVYKMPGIYYPTLTYTLSSGISATIQAPYSVKVFDYVSAKSSLCDKCYMVPLSAGGGHAEYTDSDNVGSDWVWPGAFGGAKVGYDANRQELALVVDSKTQKIYRVNNPDIWKDRCSSYYGGTDGNRIISEVHAREEVAAAGEHVAIKLNEHHVTMKAYDRNVYDTSEYDSNGFPVGLQVNVAIHSNGNPDDPTTEAVDVPMDGDIVQDHTYEARTLQTRISIFTAPWRLTRILAYYTTIDKQQVPSLRLMNEMTYQEELSQPLFRVSRCFNPLRNLATGKNAIATAQNNKLTGPDGRVGSALAVWYGELYDDLISNITTDFTVMQWIQGFGPAQFFELGLFKIATEIDNSNVKRVVVSGDSDLKGIITGETNLWWNLAITCVRQTIQTMLARIYYNGILVTSGSINLETSSLMYRELLATGLKNMYGEEITNVVGTENLNVGDHVNVDMILTYQQIDGVWYDRYVRHFTNCVILDKTVDTVTIDQLTENGSYSINIYKINTVNKQTAVFKNMTASRADMAVFGRSIHDETLAYYVEKVLAGGDEVLPLF